MREKEDFHRRFWIFYAVLHYNDEVMVIGLVFFAVRLLARVRSQDCMKYVHFLPIAVEVKVRKYA